MQYVLKRRLRDGLRGEALNVMMRAMRIFLLTLALFAVTVAASRAAVTCDQARHIVAAAVRPLMAQDRIPGVAVGIVDAGRPCAYYYGVSSKRTLRPVTADTLFEIGSISKTFTATLAAYASLEGKITLTDPVAAYIPSLRGTPFGSATLIDLGTHTVGRLPMQVPEALTNDGDLLNYLAGWHSSDAPGTVRVYNNIGIGTLGLIAAQQMGATFASLMQQRLFPALGLTNTYIDVPQKKLGQYAQGYTRDDKPIREVAGELWEETYGVRTTAPDLVRFMEANMDTIALDKRVRAAVLTTHTGYMKAGVMTQDLIWEQYAYPVALKTVLQGTAMLGKAVPARTLTPPEPPHPDVFLNKTGSTNGFAAYMAFVPEKRLGIVLLANRSVTLPERVTIAYRILRAVDSQK